MRSEQNEEPLVNIVKGFKNLAEKNSNSDKNIFIISGLS
jgi:hypothetical protein